MPMVPNGSRNGLCPSVRRVFGRWIAHSSESPAVKTSLFAAVVTCLLWNAVRAPAEEATSAATRWPQFRGPGGAGVAADGMKLPASFGPDKNVLWKMALPAGHGSPCVWDDRIFLTGFDRDKKQLATLCLERKSGRLLWSKAAAAQTIEKVHSTSSPATATPVTDGRRVYVYFGSCGLLCYDFDGNELWKHPLPVASTRFGTGTSPVLAGEAVLVKCLGPTPSLLAVAADTGKQLWKVDNPRCGVGYSPPLVQGAGPDAEVVVHGETGVACFDLKDGKERWASLGLMASAIPLPVAAEGLIFVVSQIPGGDLDDRWKLPPFDELLKKYDQDKDGRLSRQELPKDLVLFSRGDPKGVGDITLNSVISFIDRDNDGFVSRFEWFAGSTMASMLSNTLVALRPHAAGAGKPPEVAWREKASLPEVPSPVYYRGRLYLVRNRGLLSCWNTKTGKLLYEERVGATGNYYASPVAGDGKVYVCSAAGVVTVLEAGDTFRVLSKSDLGEPILATPALVDGKVYLRTEGHLYAFAE